MKKSLLLSAVLCLCAPKGSGLEPDDYMKSSNIKGKPSDISQVSFFTSSNGAMKSETKKYKERPLMSEEIPAEKKRSETAEYYKPQYYQSNLGEKGRIIGMTESILKAPSKYTEKIVAVYYGKGLEAGKRIPEMTKEISKASPKDIEKIIAKLSKKSIEKK